MSNLINVKATKEYIRTELGSSVQEDYVIKLNEEVKNLINNSHKRMKNNRRTTVMSRDL